MENGKPEKEKVSPYHISNTLGKPIEEIIQHVRKNGGLRNYIKNFDQLSLSEGKK